VGTGGQPGVVGGGGGGGQSVGGVGGEGVTGTGAQVVAGTGGQGGVGSGGAGGASLVLSGFPSCQGFTGTECQGGDCCASLPLPGGAVTVDGKPWTVPSFHLDEYEVTVARFRSFMNALAAWQAAGNPKDGAGAHPLVPGSGWRSDWLTSVAQSLIQVITANGLTPTWRDYPTQWGSSPDSVVYGGNPDYVIPGTDGLAVNQVPFHIAFAFCIWDGGRLPARAELLLAYQGGDGQSAYPWGDTPTPAVMFAVAPPLSVPTPYNDPFWTDIGIPVGSHPASVGRFGHHDLAAGLAEYARDAAREGGAESTGGFIELGGDQLVAPDSVGMNIYSRTNLDASWLEPGVETISTVQGFGVGTVGFRCARDP
jgi:sulfatase modifying factor 1